MENRIFIVVLVLMIVLGKTAFAQPGNYGNGADGILTVSGLVSLPMYAQRVTATPTATTFTIASSLQFPVGTPVYIIQMDGVGKGKNEFNTVATNVVGQIGFSSLVNTYLPSVTQVIALWQYSKVRINANSTLTTAAYNPGSGVGGVLAFLVRDCLVVKNNGKLLMTGCGYPRTFGGTFGLGGNGGVAGVPSLNAGGAGGLSGVGGTGNLGGGNGGGSGIAGTAGTTALPLSCPGCGPVATNQSVVISKIFLMGGGTPGGNAGAGGGGAGGGGAGGGNGISMGSAGTVGAKGGNGSHGANGAVGGGIIAVKAVNIALPPTGAVFISDGQAGSNSFAGVAGGNGGNGGAGAGYDVCARTGGSGGGGNGAGGGSAGNASSGGAGGLVYVVKDYISRPLSGAVRVAGGTAGIGGAGGAGGSRGISNPSISANNIPCPPLPGGGASSGGVGTGGGGSNTYVRACSLSVFQSYFFGINSLGTGIYNGTNGANTYRCTVDNVSPTLLASPQIFQCLCRETDPLGNNLYTIGQIANSTGGTTASLIGLLDSQNYLFVGNELQNSGNYVPLEWRSICVNAPAGNGPNGANGANGVAGGDGFFAEDSESRILPVPLSLFATVNGDAVALRCMLAEAIQEGQLELERSATGGEFELLGNLLEDGALGGSYSFLDQQPLSGMNYYRVRQTDGNGAVSFSEVVVVEILSDRIALSPNPTDGIVFVSGALDAWGHYRVVDCLGVVVQAGFLVDGVLDLTGLRDGIYVIVLDAGRFSRKVILRRI